MRQAICDLFKEGKGSRAKFANKIVQVRKYTTDFKTTEKSQMIGNRMVGDIPYKEEKKT